MNQCLQELWEARQKMILLCICLTVAEAVCKVLPDLQTISMKCEVYFKDVSLLFSFNLFQLADPRL